jgi:soluble lytic murein transglycosylase
MWRQQPADYPIELIPEEEALMLYPAPYADLVRRYSSERGLDPRFLLAVMRQESRFDPVAHSGAAARGLMQFIPSTADRIATELGRAAPRDDDLYDPGTSILFGSQYLADLFLIFPGQPDAVAAAYNGGEDNMARWLGRAGSPLPERYVPEIVYAQSKDYVYKVMANYRMYCVLYDVDLRPVNR